VKSLPRCRKKLVTLSISSSVAPAVEAMTGLSACCHALQQGPVCEGAAGDLEGVDAVVLDAVHGGLVEGRAYGDEVLGLHLGHQGAEGLVGQARLLEALDVLDVVAAAGGGVDEGVQVPVLELEGEVEVVFEAGAGLADGSDGGEAMGQVAHVVVGHFEDHQGLGHRSTPRKVRMWLAV